MGRLSTSLNKKIISLNFIKDYYSFSLEEHIIYVKKLIKIWSKSERRYQSLTYSSVVDKNYHLLSKEDKISLMAVAGEVKYMNKHRYEIYAIIINIFYLQNNKMLKLSIIFNLTPFWLSWSILNTLCHFFQPFWQKLVSPPLLFRLACSLLLRWKEGWLLSLCESAISSGLSPNSQ